MYGVKDLSGLRSTGPGRYHAATNSTAVVPAPSVLKASCVFINKLGNTEECSKTREELQKNRQGGAVEPQQECSRSAGEAELPCRTFVHPDSPASGAHWMKGSVTFDKIKLTNNQLDQNGHGYLKVKKKWKKTYLQRRIIVNSMHRYLPRIHLVRHTDEESSEGLSKKDGATVTFEETVFIAVTAYQNHRRTTVKLRLFGSAGRRVFEPK
ncbi:T-box [Oesophagostomum dentatum]|uniref:T-box n=1 Tax=Oesophagostomum dentatum TaxID=61180 RepID=A0A0B1TGT9_OESDE|nr:T-box [Oesophagostomum dentatum]